MFLHLLGVVIEVRRLTDLAILILARWSSKQVLRLGLRSCLPTLYLAVVFSAFVLWLPTLYLAVVFTAFLLWLTLLILTGRTPEPVLSNTLVPLLILSLVVCIFRIFA